MKNVKIKSIRTARWSQMLIAADLLFYGLKINANFCFSFALDISFFHRLNYKSFEREKKKNIQLIRWQILAIVQG